MKNILLYFYFLCFINKTTKIKWFVFICFAFLFLLPPICYADQDIEDIFASVVVFPSFSIDIDTNFLDFGLLNPGESVTLKGDFYYNTITAVSNKARRYYIMIHLLGDIIGPKGNKIPPSSLKWKVYDVQGSGIPVAEWQEFSDQPVVVYTSGPEDQIGGEVTISFQYRLDLPTAATGGHYTLEVGYMLTEEEW